MSETLFDHEAAVAAYDTETFARFKKFHHENPEVYRLFCRFSKEVVRAEARKHFGARAIVERIRWYTRIETKGDVFKVNNSFVPYYSRLAMLEYPQVFEGLFERRDSRFDVDDETLLRECGGVLEKGGDS